MTTQVRRLGYRPQLDGLRCVAISLVFVVHLTYQHFLGGWLGVELFFVLSGFLITCVLTQEHDGSNSIAIGDFYIRRMLRLTPALWVFLAVAVGWELVHPGARGAFVRYVSDAVTFRANFYPHVPPAGVGQLWTLSVEDQFYFIWPLVLFFCLYRGGRELAMKVAVAGIVLSCASGVGLVVGHAWIYTIYQGSEVNLQAILIGCVCGLLFTGGHLERFKTSRAPKYATPLGAAILVLSVLGPDWHTNAWFFAGPLTLYCLMCAVVLLGVVLQPGQLIARLLSKSLMVWVGKLSYSIYLWHVWVIFVLVNKRTATGVVEEIMITAVLSIGSYHLVEQPFDRLKSRFRVRAGMAAV